MSRWLQAPAPSLSRKRRFFSRLNLVGFLRVRNSKALGGAAMFWRPRAEQRTFFAGWAFYGAARRPPKPLVRRGSGASSDGTK